MDAERRRAPRYQFVADAELVETKSGAKSRVRTGDLSLGGCFLDTLNPPPEGTDIQVTIFRANCRFTAFGRVVVSFPRQGIGVAFAPVAPDQQPTLDEWLRELELARRAEVIGAGSPEDYKP
ncbi:MAG TPA: PilZ domain-containing protein [Candidatus Acidoferrum sp.]|nr:PilZ domain-containing protein [Candidatus Acidoferrum sp.]